MSIRKKIKKLINSVGKLIFIRSKKRVLKEENIRKILVISLYFRGDMIFHTPAIKLLKEVYPIAKIDIWTKSRNLGIIEENPLINEVLIFDEIRTADYGENSRIDLFGKYKFLKKIKKRHYDLIVDITGMYSTALFTYFSNPGYSIGLNYYGMGFSYDKFVEIDTAGTKGHLIEKYMNFIKEGLSIEEQHWAKLYEKVGLKPYLFIPDSYVRKVDNLLSQIMVDSKYMLTVHLTAGWEEKELGYDTFSDLFNKLDFERYNVIVIGVNKDKRKYDKIMERVKTPNKEKVVFINTEFMEAVEIIRRSHVFIGSDSAPLHIAGAVDTPSVGLFGPTNPSFSKPIGDIHRVIYFPIHCSATENMQYCTLNAGRNCPSIDCMKLISSEKIIEEMDYLVNKFGKKTIR